VQGGDGVLEGLQFEGGCVLLFLEFLSDLIKFLVLFSDLVVKGFEVF